MTAERVKEIRGRLGITQAEMAKSLGVSERQVRRWETGESLPPLARRGALERLFDRIFTTGH